MSYLVLARKWRPTTFDEVVGQGHVTRTLKNAITTGRVAHALLFTGSRGVGKTSCARILAKALNCDQGPTVTPCGVCTSCVEITEGRSVDVFEIDGASNNSVEQIREIREAVKFVSSRGKRKLYIIDEVHMLSTAAFNALLKTLEEPPAHVLFVFATTEPHKIPDTIVSRCQRYDFKRIPERAIVDALAGITEAEGLAVEAAALHHIAREAQGGMRDSLSLLDQVIAFSGTRITEAAVRDVLGIADRRILTDLTAAVLAGDGQGALAVVDELFRFGLDLQKFAAEFVQFLRDLMVIKVCAEPARLVDVPPEELATCARLVADVAPARIHRLFNALMRGAEEVARSPFPKLVFEMTLLRLCEQGPTLPLAEVLAGLARLEGRLDHALAASHVKPGEPKGLSMGYARMSARRTSVIIDASPPPSGPASYNAHASTLAFELTSGRRPLVVNCGSGVTFGAEWRRAGRATPSHSTLCIEGYSSGRLVPSPRDPGQETLADAATRVPIELSEVADGVRFRGGHDGYVKNFGLTHARTLELAFDGRGMAGEDMLLAVEEADRKRFDRAMDSVALAGIGFDIRLHLHPDVDATVDLGGAAISMALKSGEIWVFRHDGTFDLALEPSVYLETGRLKPRATRQIVLSGRALNHATRVRWSLAKAHETAVAVRDLSRDEPAFES